MRRRRAERVGKTPKELLTGQAHPNWLELLGFQRLAPARRSPRRARSSTSQFDRTRLKTAGFRSLLALACATRKRSKLNHAGQVHAKAERNLLELSDGGALHGHDDFPVSVE